MGGIHMLAIKQRFSNDENLLDHVEEFVGQRLRKEGLSDANAINSTNLVCSMLRTLINGTGDFVGTASVASTEKLIDYDVLDAK